MAGIGFELEKLFEKDTYSGDFGAYLAAGLVLAGAWVFSILAMVVITVASASDLTSRQQAVLLIMATYSYAGAMILTSVFSIPVTRFIADQLYIGQADAFGPTYAGCCLIHWIAAYLLGGLFMGLNPLSVKLRFMGILLFGSCTQIWLSAAFVSLLRAYTYVAASFFAGYMTSTVASIWFGRWYGLEGYVGGFTLGMVILALLLTVQLAVQFTYPRPVNFGYLKLCFKRPAFVGIGVFLAMGAWVDKILFWASPEARSVTPYLRFYPEYDMSFFLGCITVIPAYAHFLLRIETSFARHVRHVYSTLVSRAPYRQILLGKVQLIQAMNEDFTSLCKIQLPITLLAIYFAAPALAALRLPAHQVHIAQFATLAALGTVLVQVQVLYLLYFDLAGAALIPAAVYGIGNLVFTLITQQMGYSFYGLGHVAASFLGATCGALIVNYYVPQLDYITLEHFAGLTFLPQVPQAQKAPAA